MNVYRRYFIAKTGKLVEKAKEVISTNIAAKSAYLEILNDIGADSKYYARGDKLTGVMLPDSADKAMFKKVNGEAWYPKQNSKAGKALHARFNAVKTMSDKDILPVIKKNGPTLKCLTLDAFTSVAPQLSLRHLMLS